MINNLELVRHPLNLPEGRLEAILPPSGGEGVGSVVASLSVLVDIQAFVLDTGGNTQTVNLLDSEE